MNPDHNATAPAPSIGIPPLFSGPSRTFNPRLARAVGVNAATIVGIIWLWQHGRGEGDVEVIGGRAFTRAPLAELLTALPHLSDSTLRHTLRRLRRRGLLDCARVEGWACKFYAVHVAGVAAAVAEANAGGRRRGRKSFDGPAGE